MAMTASADATIQAAIQTVLRADNTHFRTPDVTLGDARGLDRGLEAANYVVIMPGRLVDAARSGDYGQVQEVWEHPVILYNRFQGDSYSTHTEARDDVLDVIGANPTLGGTDGISGAWVSSAVLGFLYPRDAGTDALPTYVLTEFTVTTVCEVLYSNTGEFA